MNTYAFRGWDLKNKEMVAITALDFDRSGQITEIDTETYCWFDRAWITLMQYTGYQDKNGIKIFEKDILKWSFIAAETLRETIIVIEDIRKISYLGLEHRTHEVEVIGNTLENPELIPSQPTPEANSEGVY